MLSYWKELELIAPGIVYLNGVDLHTAERRPHRAVEGSTSELGKILSLVLAVPLYGPPVSWWRASGGSLTVGSVHMNQRQMVAKVTP